MLAAMEWLALRVQASLACSCGVQTPMAGIREVVTCTGCGKKREAPLPFEHRDPLVEAWARGDGAPGLLRGAWFVDGDAYRFARGPLQCACGGALAWPEAGRYAKCEQCGDALPVRWPDEDVRTWDVRIACVVGDAGTAPRKVATMTDGAIACVGCKAPLAMDGRRALACDACGVANFIADDAWMVLHPDHAFTLVYQLDDRAIDSARRFLAGKHPGVTDDEAASLIARLDAQKLDDALAGHGRIDLEMARVLVQRPLTAEQKERIASWLSDDERAELGLM